MQTLWSVVGSVGHGECLLCAGWLFLQCTAWVVLVWDPVLCASQIEVRCLLNVCRSSVAVCTAFLYWIRSYFLTSHLYAFHTDFTCEGLFVLTYTMDFLSVSILGNKALLPSCLWRKRFMGFHLNKAMVLVARSLVGIIVLCFASSRLCQQHTGCSLCSRVSTQVQKGWPSRMLQDGDQSHRLFYCRNWINSYELILCSSLHCVWRFLQHDCI